MYCSSLYTHFFVSQNNIFLFKCFPGLMFPFLVYLWKSHVPLKQLTWTEKAELSYFGTAIHLTTLRTLLSSSVSVSTFFLSIGGQSCVQNFSYGFTVTLFNASISYLFLLFLPSFLCFLWRNFSLYDLGSQSPINNLLSCGSSMIYWALYTLPASPDYCKSFEMFKCTILHFPIEFHPFSSCVSPKINKVCHYGILIFPCTDINFQFHVTRKYPRHTAMFYFKAMNKTLSKNGSISAPEKTYISFLSRIFCLSLLLDSSLLWVPYPAHISFRNFHHLQIFQELSKRHIIKCFIEKPHSAYLSHFLCLEKSLFS